MYDYESRKNRLDTCNRLDEAGSDNPINQIRAKFNALGQRTRDNGGGGGGEDKVEEPLAIERAMMNNALLVTAHIVTAQLLRT